MIELRELTEEDLPILYEQARDPESVRMARVPVRARSDFHAHWIGVLADPSVVTRGIDVDGELVGHVVSFLHDRRREVGYWIARSHWGRGIATRALGDFLRLETRRPLHAGVAPHNAGSRRVLEKCGFSVVEERTDGLLLRLDPAVG